MAQSTKEKPSSSTSDIVRDMRLALLSMGYRESKPQMWLKPVGYQLFTYAEKTRQWTNWFKGDDGKIHVWESHRHYDDMRPLYTIKLWEGGTRTDMFCGSDSEFQLSAFDL